MISPDMPPPPPPAMVIVQEQPQQQASSNNNAYAQPTNVRYSDFVKMVDRNRMEKVTFSSDGTQLLGVDVDGVRVKIEALPNDPDLLTQLTEHKVRLG